MLTLEGRKSDKEGKTFLHRGISARNFKRQFTLADHVEVKGARFENGLLIIDLQREIPEAMKPRRIAINGATPEQRHPDRVQGRLTDVSAATITSRADISARHPINSSLHMEATMRPTTAHDDNIFDLNSLLHPGTMFEHPRDVVSDPALSLAEKRAILASWASDASAIASCPVAAGARGTEGPRHDRRHPGSALRARWRSTPSAGRQADAAAIGRAAGRSLIGAPHATKKPRQMPGLDCLAVRPDQYFATTGPPQLKR